MSREHLIDSLRQAAGTAPGRDAPPAAFVGFDGFIDTMYRVVRERGPSGAAFFETITDFSRHVARAAGQSADIELVRQETRIGGNAPLMSNALASLGLPVLCAGALGDPEIRPAFAALHPLCRVVSLGNPGDTSAYEFDDGKLMFADLAPLDMIDWPLVRQRIGVQALARRIGESDLVALVDWGGLRGAQGIWEGLAAEVIPLVPPRTAGGARRALFVDLADISKRTLADVLAMISLLRILEADLDVTLGLNEHEARVLLDRMVESGQVTATGGDAVEAISEALFIAAGIGCIVVHPVDRSCAVTRYGCVSRPGRRIAQPLASTGGGDNFNAGYCRARGLGMEQSDALDCGMAVSRLYVSTGRSPGLEEVIADLRAG